MREKLTKDGMFEQGTNVLLVIDMLNDFCFRSGKFFHPNCEAIIPNVKALIKKRGMWRVIFTKDLHTADDPEIKLLSEHCMYGTFGSATVEEIFDHEYTYGALTILKKTFDAFLGKAVVKIRDDRDALKDYFYNLEQIVNDTKPSVIEITGVCTDICVFHTVSTLAGLKAAGRFDFDFDIVIYRNCVATSDNAAGDYALNHLEKWFGVKIIDTAPK